MTPSAICRKLFTFATFTPLPSRIFACGQAVRTRRTSSRSAALPVPTPETMSASARPRSSVSFAERVVGVAFDDALVREHRAAVDVNAVKIAAARGA